MSRWACSECSGKGKNWSEWGTHGRGWYKCSSCNGRGYNDSSDKDGFTVLHFIGGSVVWAFIGTAIANTVFRGDAFLSILVLICIVGIELYLGYIWYIKKGHKLFPD